MKNSLKLITGALLAGALALPAFAQVGTAPPNLPPPPINPVHHGNPEQAYEKHHPYARHFGEYLEKHPGIQDDLQRDPSLVRDPAYLKAHPDLQAYFAKHPGVAEAYRAHPGQFIKRVNRTEGEGRGPY
jgi:hypothetical protein